MNAMINHFKDKYWDSYTGGLKTIVEVSLYLFFVMSVSSGSSILSNIFLVALPIAIVSDCYKAYQYRKGKEDYLLVPTKNDSYYKISSIVIGGAIIVIIVSLVVQGNEINYVIALLVLITGLGALLKGTYSLPNGMVKISTGKIKLYNYETDQSKLSLIEIKADRLLLTDIHGKKERIDNFNIDFDHGEIIRKYILSKVNNEHLMVQNTILK